MPSYKASSSSFFAISEDLLNLLYWFIEHEQESLKQIIKQAVDQGCLNQYIPSTTFTTREPLSEQVNEHMVNFLILLDTLLNESLAEHSSIQQLHRALMPSINTIDRSYYKDQAIEQSIAKAQALAETHSQQDQKEALCKELLKQWNPHKPIIN